MSLSAPPPPRRRRRSWLAGVVVGALVAGIAVGLGSFTTASPWATGPSTRFVPADGATASVSLRQGGTAGAAMQQSSRLRGPLITYAMSQTAFTALDAPDGGLEDASWWREALIPADPGRPTRYRVYSVDGRGVWLHVQDWEDRGLSLQHFLALPGDVAAGSRWTSTGRALADPTTIQLTYRSTSTASTPADGRRAAQGCLSVTADTVLEGGERPQSWSETTLWCPGAGAVEQEGSQDGFAYEFVPGPGPTPPNLRPTPWDPRDLAAWQVRTRQLVTGDQTFGAEQPDLVPAQPPALTSTGALAFGLIDGADLTALLPLDSGALWWHWWVRPGGQVSTVTAVGPLVVVTTTDREVVAYTAGGTQLWRQSLDDVAVVPAVAVGRDAVAVGTVGGQVSVLDLASGAVRWRSQLDRGVHSPLASDGAVLVAADVGPSVTAWDANTGRQRWTVDAGSTYSTTLVVHGETVVVVGGGITGYDAATGSLRWVHDPGVTLGAVTGADDQLWVERDGGLESWSMADGAFRWALPGVVAATGPASGCTPTSSVQGLVRDGRDLSAVDDTGRTLHTWHLDLTGNRVEVGCNTDGIVVTSYAGNGDTALRVQTIGPPS